MKHAGGVTSTKMWCITCHASVCERQLLILEPVFPTLTIACT